MRALLPFLSAGLAVLILGVQPSGAQTSATSAPHKPAARTTATHRETTANSPAPEPPLTTDDQKTIYALGLSIYRSLAPFSLTPAELDIIKRAMTDAAAGKPEVPIETWGPKIQGLAQQRIAQANQQVMNRAAAAPGAEKLPSGLVFQSITPGTGPSPTATDTVRVNYRGTLADGSEFDSSYRTNQPAQFALNQVIPCWTEGLQKMKVGGKAMLTCPSDLAYGPQGHPPVIPGNAVLTFEVELLGIETAAQPQAPPTPPSPPQPGQPQQPPQ